MEGEVLWVEVDDRQRQTTNRNKPGGTQAAEFFLFISFSAAAHRHVILTNTSFYMLKADRKESIDLLQSKRHRNLPKDENLRFFTILEVKYL